MEEVLHIKTSQKYMRESPSYCFKNINLHVDKGNSLPLWDHLVAENLHFKRYLYNRFSDFW